MKPGETLEFANAVQLKADGLPPNPINAVQESRISLAAAPVPERSVAAIVVGPVHPPEPLAVRYSAKLLSQ